MGAGLHLGEDVIELTEVISQPSAYTKCNELLTLRGFNLPGVVAHAFIPSTTETETGGSL